jgi:hypothetical protein
MKEHSAYAAAKAGDPAAARAVVRATVRRELLGSLGILASAVGGAWLVPVQAVESTGRNKLPLATAEVLAETLWWSHGGTILVYGNIVQANIVGHTGASAMARMLARPVFDGKVVPGQKYIVVDDHAGLGGSLSALADFIRRNGGTVVGAVALSHSGRGSDRLAPEEETIHRLEAIHEETIAQEFGIHPRALSWAEAHYLATFKDAQSLRDRIAAERVSRLLQPGDPRPAVEGGADGVEDGGRGSEWEGGMTP